MVINNKYTLLKSDLILISILKKSLTKLHVSKVFFNKLIDCVYKILTQLHCVMG